MKGQFDLDDLDRTLSQDAREAICDLTLSWARYDSLVSQWIILTFGMDLDTGSIMVGTMATRSKLERLRELFKHHKLSGSSKITKLIKDQQKHAEVRNLLAHAYCAGSQKSEPDRIVFAPVKTNSGDVGTMRIDAIHIDQIKDAAKFAESAGDGINSLIDKLTELRET